MFHNFEYSIIGSHNQDKQLLVKDVWGKINDSSKSVRNSTRITSYKFVNGLDISHPKWRTSHRNIPGFRKDRLEDTNCSLHRTLDVTIFKQKFLSILDNSRNDC